MLVKQKHGEMGYTDKGLYNLGRVYSTYYDRYIFSDGDGTLVWDASIYLRDDGYSPKGLMTFVCFKHFEPRMRFRENAEKYSKSFVDECVSFIKENKVSMAEIKLPNEMPDEIAKAIENYKRPDIDYRFFGLQLLQIILKDK